MPNAASIVLTRPEAASVRFADACRARFGCGPRIILSPLMQIRGVDSDIDVTKYPTALFTSQNGVQMAKAHWPGVQFNGYAVGDRTARAGAEAGYQLRAADGDVEALLALVQSENPEGPLLHLRGRHSRGQLAIRLNQAGIETNEAVIYDQEPCPAEPELKQALCGEMPLIVPLFSPRSATIFCEVAKGSTAPVTVVAISEATAEKAKELGGKVVVAARPTGKAMLEEMSKLVE